MVLSICHLLLLPPSSIFTCSDFDLHLFYLRCVPLQQQHETDRDVDSPLLLNLLGGLEQCKCVSLSSQESVRGGTRIQEVQECVCMSGKFGK